MDYYLDIQLLPDLEFSEQALLNALFAKFHRATNKVATGKIAVSFPEARKMLGSKLRLHGNADSLKVLMAENWLKGMKDYCDFSDITQVPADTQHRIVKRVQAKSVHNKRKRSISKGWSTEAEAVEKFPESKERKLKLPYLEVKSLSNSNRMRVYIEQGPLLAESKQGELNSYGLSAEATIPWF